MAIVIPLRLRNHLRTTMPLHHHANKKTEPALAPKFQPLNDFARNPVRPKLTGKLKNILLQLQAQTSVYHKTHRFRG
jgi:hypothetical protein